MTPYKCEGLRKKLPLLWPLLFSAAVSAAPTSLPDIVVPITGTVIAGEPCKINDDKNIMVDFGRIVISQINGVNYTTKFDLNLDCRGASSNALRVKIDGTPHSLLTGAIEAMWNPDMGFMVKANGVVWPTGTWMNIDYRSLPSLTVVPVKVPGGKVNAGQLDGIALILVEYQ